MKKTLLLRLFLYLAVVAGVLYSLYISPYNPHPQNAQELRLWVASFGSLAPCIYLLVYTFRPLLLFPTLLLNLSAGILFGPWWGVVFLLLGGLGCASFCYFLGRYGGGSWLLKNFSGSFGPRLQAYLTQEGAFMRLFWLRTVPIFPYDPVSILSGSSALPLKTYWGATLLGMLPGALAYNFLADSFGSKSFYLALLVTLVAFGLPLYWWRSHGEGRSWKLK